MSSIRLSSWACGSLSAALLVLGCGAPVDAGDGVVEDPEIAVGEQSAELVVGSCSANVEPLRSTEIVHPAIVGDARASNATNGAWSFRRLIENMAPSAGAAGTDPFLRGIFESWLNTALFVNGQLVPSRAQVQLQIIDQFVVPGSSPRQFNLATAPFELIAVASRLDLRTTNTAGEGRLIYALKTPGGGNNSMTLILEFALPLKAPLDTPAKWAAKWHELDALDPATQQVAFASKLQEITDVFTARGAMPERPNGSAINQLRTNEIALGSLGDPWQLREFRLDPSGAMLPAPTAVNPNHGTINRSQLLRDFIAQNPVLNATNDTSFFNLKTPDIFGGNFFNGGKQDEFFAFPSSAAAWSFSVTEDQTNNVALDNFGLLTCNGCHTENKATNDFVFYQVSPTASPGVDGTGRLSLFMTQGDPSKGGRRPAELTRRATDLGTLLCAPNAVDLVVSKIGMSPANPAPGQAVTFSATITNFGKSTKPAGAISGVGFKVDGGLVAWSDTNNQAILPGQTVTLTTNSGPSGSATWAATAGSHKVEAWVDDVNRIAEGDENNNKLSQPFTVGIDLAVTNLMRAPLFAVAGTPMTFSATIKNNGSVATPSGTILGVAFQIDGQTVSWSDTSTASLAPGASRTVTANFGPVGTATWSASSGRKRLAAWVDDVNRLTDVDRSNNKVETQFDVQ
jgi:hypothetical protein